MALEKRHQESVTPSRMELEDRIFAQGFALRGYYKASPRT